MRKNKQNTPDKGKKGGVVSSMSGQISQNRELAISNAIQSDLESMIMDEAVEVRIITTGNDGTALFGKGN